MAQKMKNCKYCQSEISKKAKICPVCKKKVKGSLLVNIALTFLIFVIFMIAITSGDNSSNDSETRNNSSSSTNNSNQSKENEPQLSKDEFIALCEEVEYKDLCRNPSSYKGKKLKITVAISQILQGSIFGTKEYYRALTNDEYGLWLGDEYLMYDERVGDSTKILQDDKLTIYGEFVGMEDVVRVLTSTTEEVPAVKIVYMDFFDENALTEEEIAIMNDGTIDIAFDKFSVKYIKHEVVKDFENKDCLLVYFEYTNTSGEAANFGYASDISVYQNGVECEATLFLDKDVEEKEKLYTDVQNGTTINVAQAFDISSLDEVTIEISESWSMNENKKDTMVIKLTE